MRCSFNEFKHGFLTKKREVYYTYTHIYIDIDIDIEIDR